MKRFFPILLTLVVITSSCSVHNYALGTSETEFKKHGKWVTRLVETSAERTVYSKIVANGQELYYYFVDGKLVRIDQVGPQPKIVVEQVRTP